MPTTTADLSGLFKTVYAPDLVNLIPESSKLVKLIGFKQDEKIGEQFQQPVILTFEHGVTYGAPGDGAFTLNAPISMKTQKALVDGFQHVLRSSMDYETAAKASNGGEKAFRKATELQVENMMESITKRIELDMLYGQVGIGQVDSTANVNATSTVATLVTASWATGIWVGMENATLQFFKTSDGSLISSGADSIFTISAVDVDLRKLTLTGTAAGITALDAAAALEDLDIFFNGAKNKQMAGIDKIITNTGTLFNISAATFNLWKGNSHSMSSAAATLGKILAGLAKPTARGLNEKVTVFVNDRTWANIATDQAALRKYDASYDAERAKNGMRAITFYSQSGEVELQPYNCIKEGVAYGLPVKKWKRIGATDITWTLPGGDPENPRFFRELSDSAGFEYRVYSDQAAFTDSPARSIKFTDIINS